MPTTTTNFGWTVPADTDLVKDGAAAIRTALGGVDTSFIDLKGGTTGQTLQKASGTDLDFTWASPAAGGKLLQVVQGTFSGSSNTTSTSFVDSGLEATITPSSSTSKILVTFSVYGWLTTLGSSNTAGYFDIVRGATSIVTNMNNTYAMSTDSNLNLKASQCFSYLDSPATTSATTYKLQIKVNGSSQAFRISNGNTVTMILQEIGA